MIEIVTIAATLVGKSPSTGRPNGSDADIWGTVEEMIIASFETESIMAQLDAEAAGTPFTTPAVVDISCDVRLGSRRRQMSLRAATFDDFPNFQVEAVMDATRGTVVGLTVRHVGVTDVGDAAGVRGPRLHDECEYAARVRSARDAWAVVRDAWSEASDREIRPTLRRSVLRTSPTGPGLYSSSAMLRSNAWLENEPWENGGDVETTIGIVSSWLLLRQNEKEWVRGRLSWRRGWDGFSFSLRGSPTFYERYARRWLECIRH